MTAEDEEGRRAAMQAGAEDYLTKPFSPRALVRTVEQVLEGSEPEGRVTVKAEPSPTAEVTSIHPPIAWVKSFECTGPSRTLPCG